MKTLIEIQKKLKAPKGQFNTFGKYSYRSCEDIMKAVKPLCADVDALLTVSDDIVLVGEKMFVKATATFKHDDFEQSVSSYAMHAVTKKGMDESQITGSTSSYARKYALSGLFLIDDNKDADSTNKDEVERNPANYITESQAMDLCALIEEVGAEKHKVLAWLKVSDVDDIKKEQYSGVINMLERKRGKK